MNTEQFWLLNRNMEINNFSPTTITIQGPHSINVTLDGASPSRIEGTSLRNNDSQLAIQSMIINYQHIYMSVGN